MHPERPQNTLNRSHTYLIKLFLRVRIIHFIYKFRGFIIEDKGIKNHFVIELSSKFRYIVSEMIIGALVLLQTNCLYAHLVFFVCLRISALWMCGMTPPPAMVALIRVSSSSSPLIANWRCLGVILFTLRSLLAFPANSRTSAVRYSKIAAVYTAEVAPTLLLALTLLFKNLWILPTGNYINKTLMTC